MHSENLETERTIGYLYSERKDGKFTFQKTMIEKKTSSFFSFVFGFITLLSVGLISWGIIASFQGVLSWNIYVGLGIAVLPFVIIGLLLILNAFKYRISLKAKWTEMVIDNKKIIITGEKLEEQIIVYRDDLQSVIFDHIAVKRGHTRRNKRIVNYIYCELKTTNKKYILGNIYETTSNEQCVKTRNNIKQFIQKNSKIEIKERKPNALLFLIFFAIMICMTIGMILLVL